MRHLFVETPSSHGLAEKKKHGHSQRKFRNFRYQKYSLRLFFVSHWHLMVTKCVRKVSMHHFTLHELRATWFCLLEAFLISKSGSWLRLSLSNGLEFFVVYLSVCGDQELGTLNGMTNWYKHVGGYSTDCILHAADAWIMIKIICTSRHLNTFGVSWLFGFRSSF